MKKAFFLLVISLFQTLGATESAIVVAVGTRPEAIKMMPVYRALKEKGLPVILCSTGQHSELLDQVLSLHQVQPDFDFKLMKQNQSLSYLTTASLERATALFQEIHPSMVVVQGDTSSALGMALAAFYLRIPVAHVEAGLRSHDINHPFPEEFNRKVISTVASLHFAPTEYAQKQLLSEGVDPQAIYVTGNTVVDALYGMLNMIDSKTLLPSQEIVSKIKNLKEQGKKLLLLTAHRRESFGDGLTSIFQGVKAALEEDPSLYVIYPKHPNPHIIDSLEKSALNQLDNIWITDPFDYPDLLYTLNASKGVLTDSGGIQEEAVTLCKPTLVLRKETDRPEGIQGGCAYLVGTDRDAIFRGIISISQDQVAEKGRGHSPYGDGKASSRIASNIQSYLERHCE